MTVRDVLLSAAHANLYQLYWSDEILDEAFKNLIADGQMTKEEAERTRKIMDRAFPESIVEDYDHLIAVMRNDPKDRHVVAAAVKAGAQLIVTSNVKDFYDLPEGMEAQNPDTFMCNLFELDPVRVLAALQRIAARHKRPPSTVASLCAAVGPEFSELVAAYQAVA